MMMMMMMVMMMKPLRLTQPGHPFLDLRNEHRRWSRHAPPRKELTESFAQQYRTLFFNLFSEAETFAAILIAHGTP